MEETNNIFCYKKLKSQYSKKYNFKSLILPALGFDIQTFKLETLDDISLLQCKFAEKYPYNNIDLLNGIISYDIDYIINSFIEKEIGGTCSIHNILFGMLLQEFEIPIILIKANEDNSCVYNIENKDNSLPNVSFHAANIIEFKNKKYLVDCCFTILSNYYPIELGNEIGIQILKTLQYVRIILNNNNNNNNNNDLYIYQQKNTKTDEYITIYSFNINRLLTNDEILNYHQEYSEHVLNGCGLVLYLKFNEGSYYYTSGKFKIIFNNGSQELIKVFNNTQLSKIILKYLKIKNNNKDNYQIKI